MVRVQAWAGPPAHMTRQEAAPSPASSRGRSSSSDSSSCWDPPKPRWTPKVRALRAALDLRGYVGGA